MILSCLVLQVAASLSAAAVQAKSEKHGNKGDTESADTVIMSIKQVLDVQGLQDFTVSHASQLKSLSLLTLFLQFMHDCAFLVCMQCSLKRSLLAVASLAACLDQIAMLQQMRSKLPDILSVCCQKLPTHPLISLADIN